MTDYDDTPTGKNKIFPRNLTARAAYQVPGNPPSTRPESGVENSFPGLEFDTRSLEACFFPGLRVAFQHGDGARVEQVRRDRGAAVPASGLTDADRPLFMWAVGGKISFRANEPAFTRFTLKGLSGSDVLRRVRALMPGPVALLLGPKPVMSADIPDDAKDAFKKDPTAGPWSRIERRGGKVAWALLVDSRAEHLDQYGVIDLQDHEPGELTQTLCSPWQYDFRECGCHYWAANRPDMVTADDRFTYFMRRNRARPAEPDVPEPGGRVSFTLTHAQIIAGAWNDVLPVVLNDREEPLAVPPPPRRRAREVTPAQAIAQLEYLATVEHALCVEYLYAHYSLCAPMVLPLDPPEHVVRIFAAAEAVFSVAVDEMRHLRWANEALTLLGAGPVLGRAGKIGQVQQRDFELCPLNARQLDWFIEIEKPSQTITDPEGQGGKDPIDGMYVVLLRSIEEQRATFRNADRLVPLLKLIVDEGMDHYHRFLSVKKHLEGLSEETYLRKLRRWDSPEEEIAARVSAEDIRMLDRADDMYNDLLAELASALGHGDKGGGMFLEHSRRRMHSLHEINHRLADRKLGPRFTLRPQWSNAAE